MSLCIPFSQTSSFKTMATHHSQYTGSAAPHTQGYYYQPSTTSNRIELPRSISTTNLEMTQQCQDYVRKDLCSEFPDGGTCFFMDLPNYTFTIPHLAHYPPEFRRFVFERVIDHTAKQSLEEESCLNWFPHATKLEPLHTKGDGNCLLHAASLGMWGFQDREHILRNAVSQAVSHASLRRNTFLQRWQYNKQEECKQQGYELEPHQWQREWDTVVRQASSDPTPTDTLYSLEEFHVFVLANILRRPVIMFASQKMRSFNSGGTMQSINFHGVYLPLLWAPNCCKKDPLPLSYQNGHFSALVVIDGSQQYYAGKLVLPLIGADRYRLPVRFMLPGESPQELLNDYVSVVELRDPQHQLVVPCVTLSVSTKPAYYDRFVGAFIDACYTAYQAQQQHQQQQPTPTHRASYGGYSGGSGPSGWDQKQPPSTKTAPVDSSSYAMGARQQGYSSGTSSGEHQGKIKCINSCGMYGDPETAGLCSRCHEKSLAAALQQETPAARSRSQSDFGVRSTTAGPSSGPPTSIQCPNCSRPGHPKYLGLCETCYNGSQNPPAPAQYGNGPQTQPQYGNQYQTQPQHGNQSQYGNEPRTQPQYGNGHQTQPQYGNQAAQTPLPQAQPQYGNQAAQTPLRNLPQAQPQYGNQVAQAPLRNQPQTQPQYGNQAAQALLRNLPQPVYGNEPGVQGQHAAQEPQKQENTYESLEPYQKPPIPPRGEELSPPPVPLPRSTAPPEERNKCRTPNCEFFGTAESRFYCSKCFESNMPAIFRESEQSAPLSPPPAPIQQQSYHSQVSPGHATQHTTPGAHHTVSPTPLDSSKCSWCHEYYGAPEYGGLCHGCFKNKTTETNSPGKMCRNCQEFYGAEEFGGLCNVCFLKQTERESHAGGGQTQATALPATSYSAQTAPVYMDLPPAAFTFDSEPPSLPPKPNQQPELRPTEPTFSPPPQAVPQPYSQAEYRHLTQPQLGAQPSHQIPAANARPVPKPRTRVPGSINTLAQTHTVPVPAASNVVNAMAAMNISSSNCFICAGRSPDSNAPNNLCPEHSRAVAIKLSQANSDRGSSQQLGPPQFPVASNSMPFSSHSGTYTPSHVPALATSSSPSSAHSQPYGTQYTPQSTSALHTGSTGGSAYLQHPQPPVSSQYGSETPTSRPHPSSHGNYHPSQGQRFAQQTQYSVAGGASVRPAASSGATFNNFNTNTSGSGVMAGQQEEMRSVGVGLQSSKAQGATGSGGVIMAGGGQIGIQAGFPAHEAEAAAPKEKILCGTAGCSFYANPNLEGLCNNCYEEYYEEKIPDRN